MPLAPVAPLFPPLSSTSSSSCDVSASSFTELLAMDVTAEDTVLAFEGAFMPFVAVTLPPPSLSRSSSNESNASSCYAPSLSRSSSYGYQSDASTYAPSLSRSCSNESTASYASSYAPSLSRSRSYGYESDASCYSSSSSTGYYHHVPPTTKSSFTKRHSPTGIDSYIPNTSTTNEYAQLAELWSASSSSSALVSRASIDSCTDVSNPEASSNDALLDLFMQAKPASPNVSSSSTTKITIAASSNSTTKHTKPPATGKKTKSSKNKKCTYAARRREVSALRKETSTLQKQLQELQIKIQEREQTRESVELEKILLAGAREENQRLRAVVMSQEARIRCSDGLFSGSDLAADGSAILCE